MMLSQIYKILVKVFELGGDWEIEVRSQGTKQITYNGHFYKVIKFKLMFHLIVDRMSTI